MGGMTTVRLTRDFPGGYQGGQVLVCDEVSAKALIDRGDAEAVDARVEDAGTGESGLAAPTRQSGKAQLVEFAVASGWSQEQAEASTRAQIADAFGLE